jgi:hypothetical protein
MTTAWIGFVAARALEPGRIVEIGQAISQAGPRPGYAVGDSLQIEVANVAVHHATIVGVAFDELEVELATGERITLIPMHRSYASLSNWGAPLEGWAIT